jgi:hypothetical protein
MGSATHSRLLRCQGSLDSLTRILGQLAVVLVCSIHAFGGAPSDVHLTLAVTKSPAVYHLGERIVCELSFSAFTPEKYGIVNSSGSGLETFIVTPSDGTADPRVDVSRQLALIIVGSSLSSFTTLSSVPNVVQTDLNELVRFNSPGAYRLQARSSRVGLFHESLPVALSSNEIDVHVLPADAAWTAGEISDIRKILDSSASSAEQKTTAASRLRYLNTESSTAEMVRQLPDSADEPYHHALYQGLIESSFRKTTIKMLQQTLRGPATLVSSDAVDVLTTLTLLDEYQNQLIP